WTHSVTILLNGRPNRVDTPPAPSPTARPAVTGTTEVGETLSTSDGTWSSTPTFAYAWLRNGAVIAGATAATYVLQAADEGATIQSRVTATNVGGSFSSTSIAVGPITAP